MAIRAPVMIIVPNLLFIIFSSFRGSVFTPVRSKGDAKGYGFRNMPMDGRFCFSPTSIVSGSGAIGASSTCRFCTPVKARTP